MAYLAHHGYHSISLAELDAPATQHGRAFIPTFDDGYADAYYTAAPILKRYGFKGVFYIITDFVGTRSAHMTWAQIKALAADGMVIGSHTLNHPDLTQLDAASLHKQLVDSKAALEAQLGKPVVDFCYPSGRYNETVENAVRRAGYLTAVTTRGGQCYSGEDRLALPRVRISGRMELPGFIAAISSTSNY